MNNLMVLIIIALVAGCSSTVNQTKISERTVKPWFCQSSDEDEDWDCVRSQTLVRNPSTAALKKNNLPEKTPTKISNVNSPEKTAITPTNRPGGQKNEPSKSNPIEAKSNGLPDYVNLAYSGDESISLLDLPKSYWAVQLIALSKKEALETYADQTELLRLSGARVAVRNQLLYVLLLGIYETKDLAKRAIASLPEEQTRSKAPWIRSMGSLQAAMIQGDRLADN